MTEPDESETQTPEYLRHREWSPGGYYDSPEELAFFREVGDPEPNPNAWDDHDEENEG